MATYDVDVVVSKNPPAYSVFVTVGGKHIPTAQNSDTNWEGKAKALALRDPVAIQYYGDGISNQNWNLEITLTPSDGSKAIDYKIAGKLDGNGDYYLVDKIPLTTAQGQQK
jgi:hypothetical protein